MTPAWPESRKSRDDQSVIDLVTRARAGDQQAWGALVERYAPLVWAICRRFGLRGRDAEDVGQWVWLQLVEQLDNLRQPAALPGWLATTTRRECSRAVRAARRLGLGQLPHPEYIPDDQNETAEHELRVAEQNAALRAAFLDLPPAGQRLLALLIEDPPLTYAQISATLGIPVGSIGPTRARCLAKLRHHPAIAALADPEPQARRS
jgi:RNA polymerase sigma factor (sigma-70 family)